MNALREIGVRQALRFLFSTLFLAFFNLVLFPPLRSWFLGWVGARIGADTIIHDVHFFNAYRNGFGGLCIGKKCFVGNECLVDLADQVILSDQVTLAERVVVLTHMNVGYATHPLQSHFPAMHAPVRIEKGAFVGTNVTILPGVTIGEGAFIAAGSVVTDNVPAWTLVGGVPARPIRKLRTESELSVNQ